MYASQQQLQTQFSSNSLVSCSLSTTADGRNAIQSNEQEMTMKNSVKATRIIVAIAAGFVLAAGTNGAFAKIVIRHDNGNVVKPPVYDRDGKQVNRLPARSTGVAPKKVKCGINGRSNYCAVQ
jgi:hypothetical protein